MQKINIRKKEQKANTHLTFKIIVFLASLTSLIFVFRRKLAVGWRYLSMQLRDHEGSTALTKEKLKQIDIEIRYETEKDADATLLAENVVKVIKIVLLPVASMIKAEDAKVVFVFNGDAWEIRMKNASETLRNSVRTLLSAKDW